MIITKGNMAYTILFAIAKNKEMSNDQIAELADVTRSHSSSTTKRLLAYELIYVTKHERIINTHHTTYALTNQGKIAMIAVLRKEKQL